MWWIIPVIVVGWTVLGYIANGLSGNILRILLMRRFNLNLQEVDQMAEARAYEVTGQTSSPKERFWTLLLDDLTWPYCIYGAIKGYKKIIREEERYENCKS